MVEMPSSSSSRQANFELLRVISMFLVVGIHWAIHGGLFETADRGTMNYVFTVAGKNLCTISVNCYILLTGYFMCRSGFRFEKLASTYLQLVYYSLFFLGLAFVLPTAAGVPKTKLFLCSIFPFTTMQYWFVSAYIALLFLAPYLNIVVNRISKSQFLALLAVLVGLFSILPSIRQDIFFAEKSKLALFILCYFTGAYCRRFVDLSERNWKRYLTGYLVSTGVLFALLGINLFAASRYGVRPFPCEHFVFAANYAAAVFFFLFWRCVKIRWTGFSKVVLFLSPLTFGVYLFHENPFFWKYLWHNVIRIQEYFRSPWYPVYSLAAICTVYLAGSIFDWVRMRLFSALRLRERIASTRLCRMLNEKFPGF